MAPTDPGRAFCAACAAYVTPIAATADRSVCRWCFSSTTAARTVVHGVTLPVCGPCQCSMPPYVAAQNGTLTIPPPAQAPTPPPPKPRTKPFSARPAAPVTRYQIKLLPSGAWVGWLEHGLQPVTSAQALRFDDAAEAAAWAQEKLRGRMCVVEPVEVTL